MNFDEYSERGMVRRNIACEMMADRRIYEGSQGIYEDTCSSDTT